MDFMAGIRSKQLPSSCDPSPHAKHQLPAGATSANRNPKDNADAAEEALAQLHDEELFKDPPPRDGLSYMHVTANTP